MGPAASCPCRRRARPARSWGKRHGTKADAQSARSTQDDPLCVPRMPLAPPPTRAGMDGHRPTADAKSSRHTMPTTTGVTSATCHCSVRMCQGVPYLKTVARESQGGGPRQRILGHLHFKSGRPDLKLCQSFSKQTQAPFDGCRSGGANFEHYQQHSLLMFVSQRALIHGFDEPQPCLALEFA